MIGVLYNTKNKEVIMIVQQITKMYAVGFDMRTEKATIQKIDNLEKTTLDIYSFVSDKQTIALVTQYFQSNGKLLCEIEQHSGVKQRTLHRYKKQLEYATN